MPSQLLTLAVADRFGFDTDTLSTMIFINTAISICTVALVHTMLR